MLPFPQEPVVGRKMLLPFVLLVTFRTVAPFSSVHSVVVFLQSSLIWSELGILHLLPQLMVAASFASDSSVALPMENV